MLWWACIRIRIIDTPFYVGMARHSVLQPHKVCLDWTVHYMPKPFLIHVCCVVVSVLVRVWRNFWNTCCHGLWCVSVSLNIIDIRNRLARQLIVLAADYHVPWFNKYLHGCSLFPYVYNLFLCIEVILIHLIRCFEVFIICVVGYLILTNSLYQLFGVYML